LDAVIVQNPPALPLLLVAWLYTRYKRIRQGYRPALIIDWHNLGYTMLPTGGIVQRIARKYEQIVAPWADAHWTVTTAMRQYLRTELLVVSSHSTTTLRNTINPHNNNEEEENNEEDDPTIVHTTLVNNHRRRFLRRHGRHAAAASNNKKKPPRPKLWITEVPDCPPDMFRVRDIADQHEVLTRLGDTLAAACPRAWKTNLNFQTQTLLTEVVLPTTTTHQHQPPRQPIIQHRHGRPALVTSSTSWTPDEDFGILLQALLLLDDKIQAESSSLNVLVVVTGKGPQKTMYERKISQLGLRHVAVTTLWLAPQDYPRLLAAADLGVSLHTSTSGLDLPMKVLDLFGCEVPVCAMQFACLHELVQDGVNGRVFANSEELAAVLWELLSPLADMERTTGTPTANHDFGLLAQYSSVLRQRPRWHENWQQRALPVLEQVVANLAPTSSSS
jgi:glycosyltransferase involved in cell wall biosynthesis